MSIDEHIMLIQKVHKYEAVKYVWYVKRLDILDILKTFYEMVGRDST